MRHRVAVVEANLYGFEEIAAFRTGLKGGSPQRRNLSREITTFGRDLGLANVKFQREGSSGFGRQGQTWVRTDEGWRVVSALVALIGEGLDRPVSRRPAPPR